MLSTFKVQRLHITCFITRTKTFNFSVWIIQTGRRGEKEFQNNTNIFKINNLDSLNWTNKLR